MKNRDALIDDVRTSLERVQDSYEERIDKLEKENMDLQDRLDDLEDQIERVSLERDNSLRRYSELVETVATRTSQAA